MKPKFKICDQVWFLKPSGKIDRGLISRISEVKMTQERLSDGRKIDCINDTGLGKTTVYKWWDAA